ncbi:MAG: hypothetical protein ACYDEC_07900 [Bacteroidia bacterium]
MKHEPYFPRVVAKQRAWLVNYKAKIATLGASVGLTPAQILAEQNACQAMIDEIDATDLVLVAAKAKVTERDTLIKNDMAVLRPSIGGIKKNGGYSETTGNALGIIGTEFMVDIHTVKTIVKLLPAPQGVDIKFNLEHCQGGNIYSMRGAETVFTFLKHITHPHTIDTRPNLIAASSEKRQYYVMLVINDVEVGIASAHETIHVGTAPAAGTT